jgi:hypothetical protein
MDVELSRRSATARRRIFIGALSRKAEMQIESSCSAVFLTTSDSYKIYSCIQQYGKDKAGIRWKKGAKG